MFDLQVLSGVQTNRQEINTRLTKWIIQAQWMTILKVQSWSIADLKAAPLPSTLPTSPVTGQFVWAKHSAATSDVFKNSTYPTAQLKRWHWETSSNKPLCVCMDQTMCLMRSQSGPYLCKSSLRSFVVPESNWGTSPRSASFLVFTLLHLLQSDISLFNPLCLLCFLVQEV